ncbi:MAG: alpha/beta hydrolase [Clostridium sp.]|nr:alpha/beta hydrolase [Clostridium sp.]
MIHIYNDAVPGYDPDINQEIPGIEPYLIESDKQIPAIILCPGGAYSHKAEHEGEPIARYLNSIGINVFIVNYRVSPYKYPYPFMDLQRAIRFVRYNCEKFNVDRDKIGVMGFSAGGHLAAASCVYFDFGRSESEAEDEIDKVSCRPDINILCYPVITLVGEYIHKRSGPNLLGEDASNELYEYMSVQKHVKENTPSAFIWATATDNSVPFQNSLMYAEALKEKGVDFELHIFPRGRHGLGLLDEEPYVKRWAELCKEFLIEQNFI